MRFAAILVAVVCSVRRWQASLLYSSFSLSLCWFLSAVLCCVWCGCGCGWLWSRAFAGNLVHLFVTLTQQSKFLFPYPAKSGYFLEKGVKLESPHRLPTNPACGFHCVSLHWERKGKGFVKYFSLLHSSTFLCRNRVWNLDSLWHARTVSHSASKGI